MSREHYKSIRNKPKRNSPISKSKSKMLATAKEHVPFNSAKLSEIYAAKIEWTTKVIPKQKDGQ